MYYVLFNDDSRFDIFEEEELRRLEGDFEDYRTGRNLAQGDYYECRVTEGGSFERTFVEFARIKRISSVGPYNEGIKL
jgi:hypothetical protein